MKHIKNNIPNMITISRIIACILGATFFTIGNIPTAIYCYLYGAFSDAVDGFLARKLNAITEFGKKLDPLSDKIYGLSLMIPSIILGNYLMIAPLVLEGIISSINVYSDIKYKKTRTEKIGKFKTAVLFPTMILGLLSTINLNLIIALLPMLVLSVNLQIKSIVAYTNQLNKNKEIYNKENNVNPIEKEKNNSNKENIKVLEKSYTTKINTNNKSKKLVRKKDNDDRY